MDSFEMKVLNEHETLHHLKKYSTFPTLTEKHFWFPGKSQSFQKHNESCVLQGHFPVWATGHHKRAAQPGTAQFTQLNRAREIKLLKMSYIQSFKNYIRKHLNIWNSLSLLFHPVRLINKKLQNTMDWLQINISTKHHRFGKSNTRQ